MFFCGVGDFIKLLQPSNVNKKNENAVLAFIIMTHTVQYQYIQYTII